MFDAAVAVVHTIYELHIWLNRRVIENLIMTIVQFTLVRHGLRMKLNLIT